MKDIDERIAGAIASVALPDWVEKIEFQRGFNVFDEPSVQMTVIVRAGRTEVFEQGRDIPLLTHALREAIRAADIELSPGVAFQSRDELDAEAEGGR